MNKTDERKKRSPLFWFFVTFVAMAGVALIGTALWQNQTGPEVMSQQLDAWKPYLMIWRYAVIVALIAAWKPAVEHFLLHWPDEEREKMVKARWRIAAWLIIIELVVVQGVIGKAIGGLMSALGIGGGS